MVASASFVAHKIACVFVGYKPVPVIVIVASVDTGILVVAVMFVMVAVRITDAVAVVVVVVVVIVVVVVGKYLSERTTTACDPCPLYATSTAFLG